MESVTKVLLWAIINMLSGFSKGLANVGIMDSNVYPIVYNLANAIKPIAYILLSIFALVEFATLFERMGNINGFQGTSVVISVLIKVIICKLVVDNSTEICQFLMSVTDAIANNITGGNTSQVITYAQLSNFVSNIFPEWYDPVGQIVMFSVIAVFSVLTIACISIIYVVFYSRIVEIYAYTSISPIPLSTCLSKQFNVAPNYLKNFFAIGLQGTLLILLVKIFNILIVREISGIITTGTGAKILSFLSFGSSSFAQCLQLLVVTLFISILMVICAFQTQRWAKSICHAI